MCMVSAIYDQFNPVFPKADEWPTQWPGSAGIKPPAADALDFQLQEMRQLIAEFRGMVEAAKRVDRLTSQPDCQDPEKARLEERVAALEAKIARIEGAFRP